MKKKRAVLVHINPMEGITPLPGGYMKTFAEVESEVRNNWDIQLYSTTMDAPASRIIRDLIALSPDVLGFSLYVWNIGLVERMLPALRGVLAPETLFLLGGVQVMNGADEYADRSWENVIVCNGEGEWTFRQLLLEITGSNGSGPHFDRVGGISFIYDGERVTTEANARIKDLNLIPSPYLEGVFDQKDLSIGLLETNRGCPYKCEYCFWGGAIGQKINRIPEERLRDEIAYLASKRTRSILICDANFGIFPDDVAMAEVFVKSRADTGYPLRVTYSSAKNKPERAVEIANIFAKGGVLSSQPISLQTMNPYALELAKRSNIKPETYLSIQRSMNELGVASFIELIWPLPGETLDSFKDGIQKLCCMGAQVFGVYPLVWLKNVGYENKKEELGVITMEEADPVGGGHVVIQTNEVSHDDWIAGMVFANSVMVLYDSRGLYYTASILNALGLDSFRGVFDKFVDWIEGAGVKKNALTELWQEGAQNFEEMYKFTWRGAVVETVLHSCREPFDRMCQAFAQSNTEWFAGDHGDLIAAAVEYDIVSRPFAYANTPCEVGTEFQYLEMIPQDDDRSYLVRLPYDFPALTKHLDAHGTILEEHLLPKRVEVLIDHKRGQIFRMPFKRDEDHHQFCHQFVTEMGNHLPVLTTHSKSEAVAAV